MPVSMRFVSVFAVVVLISAHEAFGVCQGTVSASFSGTTVHISASASSPCTTGVKAYFNGTEVGFAQGTTTTPPSLEVDYPVWCMPEGNYVVEAKPVNCAEPTTTPDFCEATQNVVSAFTTVFIEGTPRISVSPGPVQDNGAVEFTVEYEFPNTVFGNHQAVRFYLDGEFVTSHGFGFDFVPTSGTFSQTLNLSCGRNAPNHEVRVVAASCTGGTAEQIVNINIDSKPILNVTYSPDSAGYGVASIDYDFPHSAFSRRVAGFVDGVKVFGYGDLPKTGHINQGIDVGCLSPGGHEVKIVAEHCNPSVPGTKTERLFSVSVNPTPDINLSPITLDSAGNASVTLSYTVKDAGPRHSSRSSSTEQRFCEET